MKKILFLSLALMEISNVLIAQDYHLQLHIEGIRFDTLCLFNESISRGNMFKIYGESADGSNWKFSIPDSAFQSVVNFYMDARLKEEKLDSIIHRLIFLSYQNGDTLNYAITLPLDHKINEIYAKYRDTQVIENAPMIHAGDNEIYYATLHYDKCEIPLFKNSEFEVQAYHPLFPYQKVFNRDTLANHIGQCLKIIEKYPDSHYLIGRIAQYRADFAKEGLQKVFDAFSENNRQSDFGKIIDVYLKHYFVFSNMKLPKYDNDNLELIIQDSTKMNLIVFSASWCMPCIEEIPILKEIYNDLNDRLNITYISMDNTKTAVYWKNLMREKAIPWRSLMAKNNITTVQEKYNPSKSIPYILLVYPNKRVEIVDVRNKEDKDKLYSVCKEF